MPYKYDPYNNSYVWYEEGTTPPTFDRSGEEQIPGWTDSYTDTFPNQPASKDYGSSTKVIDLDDPANNSPAPSSSSSSSGPNGEQRNAYETLKRLFEGYGLGTLSSKILEYVQQGYGPDTISLMLQDTPEYKQRFAGNETRRKNNLSVLSPAEYLEVERSYRQIMESNGMPKGFYDSLDDFTSWIGSDVSPAELTDRVNLASRAVNNSDDSYLSTLRDYGLGQGDLVAAMLDRNRALPFLQKTVREAEIGAEARRQGLALSQARAGQFESMGVTGDQAAQAYQTIGEVLTPLQQLGRVYGEDYGQTDIEDELLGRSGAASTRRARLQSRERSSFSGQSAVGQKTLGGKSRGQF